MVFLNRDDYYDPESADVGIAEVIVAKNRTGALATVTASWRQQHASFKSLTGVDVNPPPGRFSN